MIKIFNENDKDFSTAGNITIDPIKCKEFKKKSLNGWYIEVELPIRYKEYIAKDKLCVIKTKSKLNPQAFRIGDNIKYTSKKISFTANHVMFDSQDYFLVDIRPTNLNGLNTLNYINERTDKISPFKIYSDVENINTAYFIRKSLLEAWTVIEERWNGVFDADNWDISFLQKVGHDNGESIIYGKNLEKIEVYEDWSNVVTRLYPVGYNELMLPEVFLESDIQYEKPYTRKIDFQTELETEEQTEENLIEELRNNATKYLEENKYPKFSYTLKSDINQNLEIGDIIHVLHPIADIMTEVLEYEYDNISEKVRSITFGNYTRNIKTKFDNIKNSVGKLNETLSKQMSVIERQTELINSLNKNGYVYIDDNEILILDKIPKETAKNVWRFGLGGIGFSSNGYEGPFEIAITMDGQINANFITTGTLSVSRIEGLANKISEYDTSITEINLNLGNITQSVSDINQNLSDNYYTRTQTDSQITQKADSITSEVNQTIKEAKEDAISSANTATDNKLKNYSTTTQMNSAITQKANEITSSVSETYSTKEETNTAKQDAIDSANTNTDNKLKNYSTTSQMNSKIEQTAESINSEVSKKVGEDEIISKINQSAETVGIMATKIKLSAEDVLNLLAGNTINLSSKNINISSDALQINSDGIMELRGTENVASIKLILANNEGRYLEIKPTSINLENNLYGHQLFLTNAANGAWVRLISGSNEINLLNNGDEFVQISLTDGLNSTIINPKKITTSSIDIQNGNIYNAANVITTSTISAMNFSSDNSYIDVRTKSSNAFGITVWASDKKLKENINNSNVKALDIIKQIKHRQFDWKINNKHQNLGYIAQEMEAINEEFVIKIDQNDEDVILQINETKIIPYLSKAIQEQQEEIELLKEKDKQKDEIIANLITRIENLEKLKL